jgi:hypothetical protein
MVNLLEGGLRRILLCGLEQLREHYLSWFEFGIGVGMLILLFVLRRLTLISLEEENEVPLLYRALCQQCL